jgi:hypothetical protein
MIAAASPFKDRYVNKKARIKIGINIALIVVLPLCIVFMAIGEHARLFDRWRGLDQVENVSDSFNHSYGVEPSKPVYPGTPEWAPTLRLIEEYSKHKLRTDREPSTIARMKATQSIQEQNTDLEWTSPSTPIVVLYRHWPGNSAAGIGPDYTIVGSIGDLQTWIAQSKAEFHFVVNDIILGLMSVALGVWLVIHEATSERKERPEPRKPATDLGYDEG